MKGLVSPRAASAPIAIVDWGRTEYQSAWSRQNALVAERLAGSAGDTLVFTEHDPVYTLGVRPGADKHVLCQDPRDGMERIPVVKSNRGGDVTYHGPGQIVGYPIVDLSPRKDLHAYLRLIEQVIIQTLGALGLVASRRTGMTGIWLGTRKIAAIGVGSRRWITFHGFALNVNTDLRPFAGIVPCGITDGTVTSLQAELGREMNMAEIKRLLADAFRVEWTTFLSSHSSCPPGLSPENVMPESSR